MRHDALGAGHGTLVQLALAPRRVFANCLRGLMPRASVVEVVPELANLAVLALRYRGLAARRYRGDVQTAALRPRPPRR
jgi:hypothetical protein